MTDGSSVRISTRTIPVAERAGLRLGTRALGIRVRPRDRRRHRSSRRDNRPGTGPTTRRTVRRRAVHDAVGVEVSVVGHSVSLRVAVARIEQTVHVAITRDGRAVVGHAGGSHRASRRIPRPRSGWPGVPIQPRLRRSFFDQSVECFGRGDHGHRTSDIGHRTSDIIGRGNPKAVPRPRLDG